MEDKFGLNDKKDVEKCKKQETCGYCQKEDF